MSALLLLALVVGAPSSHSQAIQDSRCYLMNGGAVESFFISEDTPVGSIVGTLSVNGDPDEQAGNISLKLQERGAAVGIAPGSKNLTLLRTLDREEKLGPSSVYVNVRCDRRHTADPSFVIPVSIRVWDVNDNAPAWVGAPYRARVSELAAVGARVLSAPAADPDQPGPHATVHYSVLGPAEEYIAFANELDSTIVIKKPLDYEKLRNLTATLRARDAGSPPRHSDATLLLEVLDADDQNPKFTHEHYVAVLPDDAQEGTELETSPGPISARDQDEGINAPLVYSVSAGALAVQRDSGRLAATAALLQENLPLTVVIKATQIDNSDRYALATVSVRRRVARGAPPALTAAPGAPEPVKFTRSEYNARVSEDAAVGTLVLTLTTSPTTQTPLQFYVSDREFLDSFAINAAGEVLLRSALDYETTPHYRYRVMVTDGHSNDTASLNITVDNVNEWEPRFRYPLYEFQADLEEGEGGRDGDGEGVGLLRVGKLDVHDGDTADTVSLTLRGLHAPLFYINAEGEIFLRREALHTVNSSVLHLVATAHDSGSPPRQSSVPVAVHVSGVQAASEATRSASVLVTFLVALVLLAVCVLALLLYICTVRRRPAKGDASSGAQKGTALPPPAAPAAGSGSLQSVSAGASTILDSTSSLDIRQELTNGRQSQRTSKSKVAPAPPTSPAEGRPHMGAGGDPALMSDHLGGAGGRSGVAWPSATIPARVKKLSWDDARPTEEGGAVEATNPAVADHMNLTVYF